MKERHIKILEKLVDFQFEKNPKYNVENEALEMYSEYVKFVAKKGIEILSFEKDNFRYRKGKIT